MAGKRWSQWPCGCHLVADDQEDGHVWEVRVCDHHLRAWLIELRESSQPTHQLPLQLGGKEGKPLKRRRA